MFTVAVPEDGYRTVEAFTEVYRAVMKDDADMICGAEHCQPLQCVFVSSGRLEKENPMTDQTVKDKLKAAIDQVRADLKDLEDQLPTWNSTNISGTRLYRPITDRIVAATQRLKSLVAENTYSSR